MNNPKSAIRLRCECGDVQGLASGISPDAGTHVVCLCEDCQAFAHYLEKHDSLLDVNGGTEIYQLTPSQLEIHSGVEKIKCVQLYPSGMLRWYAACCKSPIANTMQSPRVPFAGLHVSFFDKRDSNISSLGHVRARIHGSEGRGELPYGTHEKVPVTLIFRTVRKMLRGFVLRQHTPSPFFVETSGRAIAAPRLLTADERQKLIDIL